MSGDCSSVASHDFSLGRSLSRSISDSLTVVYFSMVGVVLKFKRGHRRTRLSMMAMHVDMIHAFVWMRCYAEARSVSPIRMIFDVHLICMALIMWGILRMHNLLKHGCRLSF